MNGWKIWRNKENAVVGAMLRFKRRPSLSSASTKHNNYLENLAD